MAPSQIDLVLRKPGAKGFGSLHKIGSRALFQGFQGSGVQATTTLVLSNAGDWEKRSKGYVSYSLSWMSYKAPLFPKF